MAGPFWGSIASGFNEGQDLALQREMYRLKLKQAKDEEAQQEKVRANSGLLGDYFSQGMQPPPQQQQGPQPPPPGQASMPPQQPPQGQPPPPVGGGMPQGQPQGGPPPPPQSFAQLPPQEQQKIMRSMGKYGMGTFNGMPITGGPPPLPPYTSPQPPPQQQQQPQGMPPPPPQQSGMPGGGPPTMNLPSLWKFINEKNPGLDGQTKFRLVMQAEPILNQEGKMQLAMATQRIKEQDEQIKRQNADTRGREADTHAADANRRDLTSKGATEYGAAKIGSLDAGADAARARAEKSRATPTGPKPGKPQIFTGTDGQTYSRMLMPDGQIITRDSKGQVAGDDGEAIQSAGSPGQQTMRNTVKLDITEIDYALQEIGKLNSKTASPFFLDSGTPGATGRWTKNALNPGEMQQYDVYANRVATAIAGMQSMGRGQVSDAKIASAQKLVPVPGDSDATIKAKLSSIQRIRDNANDILAGKSPDDIKGGKTMSDDDKQAAAWAKANPNDPRAAEIKKRLGQ